MLNINNIDSFLVCKIYKIFKINFETLEFSDNNAQYY